MRRFRCSCGQALFFDSDRCGNCGRVVGYAPDIARVVALERDGLTSTDGSGRSARRLRYRRCANGARYAVCNWLVTGGDDERLCAACELTRTLPDLSQPANQLRWGRLEAAKRRLLYTLSGLGLAVESRAARPDDGLAFDFLEDRRSNPAMADAIVHTGHADGVITINVLEADPVEQVRLRERMNEQYRTLLGHMRHESGHYYWDRLIRDGPFLDAFRERFGDERRSYAEALADHYRTGPAADWGERHVSAYACAHPWEDWAETWAHYLHMVDTLDTAADFGLLEYGRVPARFADKVDAWMPLTVMLNELNRSMGQDDPYPFVLSAPVIDKLHFVHDTVKAHVAADEPG